MGRTRVQGGNFNRIVKRAEIMARAKPFERLCKFRARMEEAAPKSILFGKPLVLSNEYRFRYVPAFKVFKFWVKFPVWTTTLLEQHYAE